MPSLDVVSKINVAEVDNAVNGISREIKQRFDLKERMCSIEHSGDTLTITADNNFLLRQMLPPPTHPTAVLSQSPIQKCPQASQDRRRAMDRTFPVLCVCGREPPRRRACCQGSSFGVVRPSCGERRCLRGSCTDHPGRT